MQGRCAATLVALLLIGAWHPATGSPRIPRFAPKTDALGYIDVWPLRRDVARAEALYVSPGPYLAAGLCSYGASNQGKTEREIHACEQRVERKQRKSAKAVAAFNHAWLPAIQRAAKLGDPVATVIYLDCDTTPVLDRSGTVSTCDTGAGRSAAIARLKKIGFAPAIPLEPTDWQHFRENPSAVRLADQKRVLAAMRGGALGLDPYARMRVIPGGNGLEKPGDLEMHRNAQVITAVVQDATRAFTFTPLGADTPWRTNAFGKLRLNRQPLTPGVLTWGRSLYSHAPSIFTGFTQWRSEPLIAYDKQFHQVHVSGPDVPAFRKQLSATLTAMNASIDTWLRRDPRWGVFLLHRVGHHEWVPERMHGTTGNLNPVWAGHWKLVAQTSDWDKKLQPANGDAWVRHFGATWQISERAAQPPKAFPDVTHCTLRYSGGVTYLPDAGNFVTAIGNGNNSAWFYEHHMQVLSALNPHKRYKQVLMQCESAESPDSDRIRFLLHARNRMLEIGQLSDAAGHISLRVYQKVP